MTHPTTYPSKSAQKQALDSLSRHQLRPLQQAVQKLYLDSDRTSAALEKLYYDMPDTVGSLRDSHVQLLHRAGLSTIANSVSMLMTERDEIKAGKVVKPVSKAVERKAKVDREFGDNVSLKAKLLEKAPILAREYRQYWERVVAELNLKGAFKLTYKDVKDDGAKRRLRDRAHNVIMEGIANDNGDVMTDRLAAKAKQYGEDMALNWYYKMAAKLGSGVTITLADDDQGGDVMLSGTVTKDGTSAAVEVQQQRVSKVSSRGVFFHQFPARIYVNGQFITEADFAKWFHNLKADE